MIAQARLNLIDRVLGYVDPERAARRMRARMFMAVAGSFVGASNARRSLKNWNVTANSADEDTVDDLETLRARSRDMVRNTPLATGAIGTVVQNVVGTGLTLQAKPDWEAVGRKVSDEEADAWTAQVEREFRLWAEGTDCDLTRTQDFCGSQCLHRMLRGGGGRVRNQDGAVPRRPESQS
jgi:capsid protein